MEGIPTKFIIGPDSNIRFRAVGYSGNPDQLADEVSIMIEAAKSGAGNGKKKGF